MINNIAQLKSEILRRDIAKEEDLLGCGEKDIDSIEVAFDSIWA
jgi:hypothetical protein